LADVFSRPAIDAVGMVCIQRFSLVGVALAFVTALLGATPPAAHAVSRGCVVFEISNATGQALTLADRALQGDGVNADQRWTPTESDDHCIDRIQDPPQEIDPGTTWKFGALCWAAFGCSTFTGDLTYVQSYRDGLHYNSAVKISFSDPRSGANTASWSSFVREGAGLGDYGVQSFEYNQHNESHYDLKIRAIICVARGPGAVVGCPGTQSPRLAGLPGPLGADAAGRLAVPVTCGTRPCRGRVTVHRRGALLASAAFARRRHPSLGHARLRLIPAARRLLAARKQIRIAVVLRDGRGRPRGRKTYVLRRVATPRPSEAAGRSNTS
jgi:hypothetical protein